MWQHARPKMISLLRRIMMRQSGLWSPRHWPLRPNRSPADLDYAEVKQILSSWGIRQFRIKGLLGGSSATNVLIQTKAGLFVLRRVSCGVEYLTYQIRIMRHLIGSTFPYDVPTVVATCDGGDFVLQRENAWLLYRFLNGSATPSTVDVTLARAIGSLVAHYHVAVGDMDRGEFSGRFNLELFKSAHVPDAFHDAAEWLPGRRDTSGLGAAFGEIHQAILEAYDKIPKSQILLARRLPLITLYNDWHLYNMIVRGNSIVGLIDYDSAVEGPRVADFQNALSHILQNACDPPSDLIISFVAGYGDVSPLSVAEAELVYPVMLDRLACRVVKIIGLVHRDGISMRETMGVTTLRLMSWLLKNKSSFTSVLEEAVRRSDQKA